MSGAFLTEIEAFEEEQVETAKADLAALRIEFAAYKQTAELEAKTAVRQEVRGEFIVVIQSLVDALEDSSAELPGLRRALAIMKG